MLTINTDMRDLLGIHEPRLARLQGTLTTMLLGTVCCPPPFWADDADGDSVLLL